jgi:phosphoribosylamine--glycine ligase
MKTAEGPKLIEYNVRFGDPETQVILPRLRTDLLDVFIAMESGTLDQVELDWRPGASAAVVLVGDTYPGKVESGKKIAGLAEAAALNDVTVYHAGTRWEDGNVYTAGGRILNVTATGATLEEALEKAYAAAALIDFDGKAYRRDIGQKGLKR